MNLYNLEKVKAEKVEQPQQNTKKAPKGDQEIISYYTQILPKLQATLRTFEAIVRAALPKNTRKMDEFHKAHSSQPIVLTNLKPVESVISKVKRGKSVFEIGDLVRGAVLLPSHKDTELFLNGFVRKNQSIITGHEAKAKGDDKIYGYYGSQHIDLVIDGIRCELQVMTQKLWKMKHEAHKIYTRTRENKAGATESDLIQSRNMFITGNKPKFQREDLIEFLEIIEEDQSLYEFLLDNDDKVWLYYVTEGN